MVETLCELYGESIDVPCLFGSKTFYDFADLKRMNNDPTLETVLRVRGFGYRALNIALASKALVSPFHNAVLIFRQVSKTASSIFIFVHEF